MSPSAGSAGAAAVPSLPLAGVALSVGGPPAVVAVAGATLRALGATVERRRPAGRSAIVGFVDPALDAGLPSGTIERAAGLAVGAGAVLSFLAGAPVTVAADAVAAAVLLPALVEGAARARPGRPRPAPGGGWLCADLGAPGDEDTYARLLATLDPRSDAMAVESAAQEWRLPVVAYRPARRPAAPPVGGAGGGPDAPARPTSTAAPLAGVEVVDVTAMWAGPLAAWLLAALGAGVTTVEAPVRPDGMRGQPATFAALDRGKRRVALDLRDDRAHRDLVARARHADVLLDSFSPRVMPNLGLARHQLVADDHPLVTASITAFPAGTREQAWVAYGGGVHAFCGLGDLGGRYRQPAVSYPDPLAGLSAFAAVLAGLAGRGRHGRGGGHARVSLVGATAPLASCPGDPELLAEAAEPGVAGLGARLAAGGWIDADGLPHPPFSVGAPS